MSGWLRVVGLGPGPERWITPEARRALAEATDLVGYGPYLARVTLGPGQTAHASDNGAERARAGRALQLASDGARVALVSGGDPGVFAMAAALFEVLEEGPAAWRALDVAVLPGVTAMLAAAARLGAPLGNDFCAINLSDNLKPWSLVERRLRCACEADFNIALYNPASRARPHQLERAFAVLRALRTARAPVIFARAVGRPDEALEVYSLGEADPKLADMRTVLLVGSSTSRCVERRGGPPWVYSPRHVQEAPCSPG